MTCGNCVFARPAPKNPAPYRLVYESTERPILECHRYPPVVADNWLMPSSTQGTRPAMMFPQVDPEDWCGEYQGGRPYKTAPDR